MKPFIPIDCHFSHVVGAECHYLGPLVLVIELIPGKTTLTHAEYRKLIDYHIHEGFLTDEHKAWLLEQKRTIVPIVVDANKNRLEMDEMTGDYQPTY